MSNERLSKLQIMILTQIYECKKLYCLPIIYSAYYLLKTDIIKKYNLKNTKSFNVSFSRSIKNLEKKGYIKRSNRSITLCDYDYWDEIKHICRGVA